MDRKIKVAFIKFAGLCTGGTEKFLQSIAANLPNDKFIVDYFYCDAAPYVNSDYKHIDTDPERLKYMIDHNVNLIKFNVGFKDVTVSTHNWLNTNFWDVFKEEDYDVVITGRAGHREYPFYLIKKTPIIDTLHLNAGADNQRNIKKVIHLSEWHAKKWIKTGGDRQKVEVICQPLNIVDFIKENYREKFGLINKFIFGFHQRNDDYIFSPMPLEAYAQIENEKNHFVLLNGSIKYREQAQKLGIKNITFLPFAKKLEEIYNFLQMLDVYTHGRKDGETSGAAIAEAMAFGLPIISHFTKYNNGQLETIGPAGKMVKNLKQYVDEMKKHETDEVYHKELSEIAKNRFINRYSFERQIKKIENIITDVADNKVKYESNPWFNCLSILYQIKYKIKCKLGRNVKLFIRMLGKKNI